MRTLLFSFLLLPPLVPAGLFHSLADDLYAFPKYRVTFLNGLPLLNETAERWLREGLRGGEAEFLDHPTPWREPPPFKHIDAGEGTAVGLLVSSSVVAHALTYSKQATTDSVPEHAIEMMKMGLHETYLCFIPAPIKRDPPPPEETITEVTASHSWSLLQPLDGTCLYVCDLPPSSSGYKTADHPQSIAKDGLLTPTAITRTFANFEKCSTSVQWSQVMLILGSAFSSYMLDHRKGL